MRIRRLETAEWASSFIPLLAEARRVLPEYAGTGEPSRQAYANWLNRKKMPSRQNGRWQSESIGRLFDIHIGLIDEAEQEFDIAIGIIRFKWQYADAEARKALAEEEIAVREYRAQQINDAYRLSAELRGRSYTDQDIPPRLLAASPARQRPISARRKKKRGKAAPPLSTPPAAAPPDEPLEVQLSLF